MLKKLTRKEFLDQFDPSVHQKILDSAKRYGSKWIVCFENQLVDSSHFGERSALTVGGPDNTLKTLEDAEKVRLGDLPSTHRYPTCYMETGT